MDLLEIGNLKKIVKIKAIQVAFITGLLLPPVILKFYEHEYNLDFFYKIGVGFFFIFPIIFIIIYLGLLIKYKCPACNKLWSYQKIGEEIINSYIKKHNNVNKTIQDIVIEYKCSNCNFIKFIKKQQKLRVRK